MITTAAPTTALDPVTLEVIRNALPAISDEMSFDLQRTSYNMMIYEVRDYCTALLDAHGNLVSQNIGGVSHFVADLGVVIKDGVRRFGLDGFAPGDVVIHNHQRVAGQHLNNVVVYTPVFWEGAVVAFAVVRAHWVDVGIMSTGFGASTSFDAWSEGLQFDQLKLYERGVPDRKLMKLISDNVRYPEAAMGDLRSQIAACTLGDRRFTELFRRYGKDTTLRAIDAIYDETERKCRAVVAEMPDGTYTASSLYDPMRKGYQHSVIKVTVTIAGSDMTMDFSECSPESAVGPNARTYAGAYIAYKAITVPMEPVNEGSFRALRAIIPEGNMMMARFPNVTMAPWSPALPTIVDTVLRALADAIPDRVPAAHSGSLGPTLVFFGYDPRRDRRFVVQSIEGGGWGGRPFEDGESVSASVCQGDVRNAPIENIELKNPVLVTRRGLREGSGGPGKFRGGLGVHTEARNLFEGRWNVGPGNRTMMPPWGIRGGKGGVPEVSFLKTPKDADWRPVDDAGQHLVPAGSEIRLLSSGGGGWGDPLERDPALVLGDVIEEYVTVPGARDDYGVVLAADGRSVDEAATASLRLSRRGGAAPA